MLDRALAKVFSDLSTLILVACVFTLPIHLAHAFVFQDELAVRELAPEMAGLGDNQQVRGVTRGDVELHRKWLAIVVLVEIAASVVVYRAAKRVYGVMERNGVPSVPDAYRHLGARGPLPPIGPTLTLIAIAGVAGWLVLGVGTRFADMAPADLAWIGIGTARGIAVATFLAIAAGGAAGLDSRRDLLQPEREERLDLY